MRSILIVCTANICRSPMAEVLLRKKISERQIEGEWQVGSAGTWGEDGLPASSNGITVMRERGLDTSSHLSLSINEKLLEEADLVLAMTAGHVESLKIDFPEYSSRIFRLAEMAGAPYDIEDPYGGSLEDYRRTADELAMLLERGLERIIQLAATPLHGA